MADKNHKDITGSDLHITKAHASEHQVGGSDIITITGVIPVVFGKVGGTAPVADDQIWIETPNNIITLTRVTLQADQSGSIVIDIWKDTYANYPPTNTDSITASAPPTISSATKSTDATLTDWTKTIPALSQLVFNVDSITDIEQCTLNLHYTRTL